MKLFIDSMLMSLMTISEEPDYSHLFGNYFIILGEVIAVLVIISLLITFINNMFGLITRIRDNFSILTYSLFPHIFALIILFIVEVTVFGETLFSKNPSPFSLKEFLAVILAGLEILIVLWQIFLSIIAIFSQSKNLSYSIIIAVIFNLLLYFCLYQNSLYLYR
jgi:hypothetical protein